MSIKKYRQDFNQKKTSIDDVLQQLQSNTVIGTPVIPMTPQSFFANLHRMPQQVENVEVYTLFNPAPSEFISNPAYQDRITNNCWFFGGGERAAADAGVRTTVYVPNNAHQAISDVTGRKKFHWFVGSASPMDEHGYLSLSCSAFIEKDLIRAADTVILEVNPNAPRTFGDTAIHISEIDHVIEVDHKLFYETIVPPSATEKKIGEFVADLIDDGSTIQMGIGGVPYAVSHCLYEKKDLGVHTEMLTEAMLELYQRGVITNRRKTLHPGKFVAAFAFGTQKLYDFIDNNPAVNILSGSHTNDPFVLGQNYKMISINTAMMVDLTGQVCSEAMGSRHYSGTGGQLDTHRGAVRSNLQGLGGKGIISLRSTAKKGTLSTIVPMLPQGSPVTVPRQDVDYIVTEYGVAHLRGHNVRERAGSLIAIAHPDHRAELRAQAIRVGIL